MRVVERFSGDSIRKLQWIVFEHFKECSYLL